ncbi:MAG: hypothetical protein ACM31J_00315 [Nitrososphaerales archaeon]
MNFILKHLLVGLETTHDEKFIDNGRFIDTGVRLYLRTPDKL